MAPYLQYKLKMDMVVDPVVCYCKLLTTTHFVAQKRVLTASSPTRGLLCYFSVSSPRISNKGLTELLACADQRSLLSWCTNSLLTEMMPCLLSSSWKLNGVCQLEVKRVVSGVTSAHQTFKLWFPSVTNTVTFWLATISILSLYCTQFLHI